MIVASMSPSTPCRATVAATSTVNAAAGPPIWKRLPPSAEIRKPPMAAVNSPRSGVTPEAMARLKAHPWPGNVRELRNALERACLLAGGEIIDEGDLLLGRPAPAAAGKEPFALPPGGVVLEELEKSLVSQALERAAGNQTKAATLLGISRDQLRYRMEKHGLPHRV